MEQRIQIADILKILVLFFNPISVCLELLLWEAIRSRFFKPRCPACDTRSLVYVSSARISNYGDRINRRGVNWDFFRCEKCEARWKREAKEWIPLSLTEWKCQVEGDCPEEKVELPKHVPPVERDYDEHQIQYVKRFFPHLFTLVEKAALNAITVLNEENGVIETQTTFRSFVWPHIARRARKELEQGRKEFVLRTNERLCKDHGPLIMTNTCPKCKRLPATPQARLCIWCGHTWIQIPTHR